MNRWPLMNRICFGKVTVKNDFWDVIAKYVFGFLFGNTNYQ